MDKCKFCDEESTTTVTVTCTDGVVVWVLCDNHYFEFLQVFDKIEEGE